jgi:hypothetical protein
MARRHDEFDRGTTGPWQAARQAAAPVRSATAATARMSVGDPKGRAGLVEA